MFFLVEFGLIRVGATMYTYVQGKYKCILPYMCL
jgi:hypothetical protein